MNVNISKKGEEKVVSNYPWVYDSEITNYDSNIIDGDIVTVLSSKNKFLGSAFYNSKSKIRLRMISRNTNDKFDKEFFKRRVEYAFNYRKSLISDMNAFRLIYGESDELPGLTVDVYNDIVVCQVLSLGIEKRLDLIIPSIYEVLTNNNIKVSGIYMRNDIEIRKKEGLELYKGWYNGYSCDKEETIISENGIKYYVDFINGQKTGFFLDQKDNRMLVRKISFDKRVLDCCTHTGSFAMNAYLGNAKKVVALDISSKALDDAKRNFELNNISIETVCSDMFDYLENINRGEYDLIILDPPSFAKNKNSIHNALSGYTELNYLAMKKLNRGGFLVTASCSHFAKDNEYLDSIYKASIKASVKLKLVSHSGPSIDHPELIGFTETNYLKFYIFQVF